MTKDEAKAQLEQLEQKLAVQRIKAGEQETAIAGLSLPAQTGDAAARKQLDRLIAETTAIAAQERSLSYAISAARERLVAFEAADRDAAECALAQSAIDMLPGLRARGARLDAAWHALIAEMGDLEGDLLVLDRLSYSPTTVALAKVNLQLASGTALQRLGLQQIFLAPRQRRSFSQLVEGWADSSSRRAQARLDRSNANKEHAA